MSDRIPPGTGFSRRRVLAGLAGVGAIGAAGGAGTYAHFSDTAALPDNELGAGEVAFDVSCDGACTTPSDGVVQFTVDGLDRGSTGSETVQVAVRTNPARLWLATTCPPADDLLGDALEVVLRVGNETVFSGALGDLRREFVTGIRIDDIDGEPCLVPGAPIPIRLEWELPESVPASVGGESTAVELRLYTEQCRHVSEADAAGSNPFVGTPSCVDPCVVCADENGTKIGSLTFAYLGSETATVTAAATGGGAGGVGQGGTVVFSDDVDPNAAFTIDAGPTDVAGSDGNWIGPNLYVDDGSDSGSPGNSNRPAGVKIHTSCSVPLVPGMVFGNFELVSGTTVDGDLLCDNTEDPEGSEETEESEGR